MQHKRESDLCRVLTLKEALNGIPGSIESVDLTTSSGYPFSLMSCRGAKRNVIQGEPGELELSSLAQQVFDDFENDMDNDIIPMEPYIVTLKDEKRGLAKVQAFLTRIFCAGSLCGFLHNKMLFGAFAAFMQRIRGVCFSTLGLNRSSIEWHQLMMRMLEVGPHGLDGDQKQWDGRFKAGVAMEALNIIHAFYDDAVGSPNWMKRNILFLHSVFPVVRQSWTHPEYQDRVYTVLFQIIGCMPSGWYMTFLLNSMVNALLFRIAWRMILSAPVNDLYYFRKYTRDLYAGDDNLVAVADDFLEEFNNITLQKFFATYEQVYTSSDKSGEMLPYKPLVKCQFLKLTTGKLFDRYVPLFDMNANLETINWIRKCDDPRAATEANCNDVLRNLFFYGEEVFYHYRGLMLQADNSFSLLHYGPLQTAYLGYGVIPDPTGAYAYTRNAGGDPMAAVRAVQSVLNSKQTILCGQLRELSLH
jgi:hypothetical protein